MKKEQKLPIEAKLFLIASALFVVAYLFGSCVTAKKALAPKHDADAAVMSQTLQTSTYNFYSELYTNPDKSYKPANYAVIDASIRELAVHDSARKHSDALMIIVHDAENRFHKYEKEHQVAGVLTNPKILTYQEGIDALLYLLVVNENYYK